MSIFNHDIENIDIEKEIKVREMQLTYLEGMLELRKEELEADFDNLFREFNEFKKDPESREMYDRLNECKTSLSNFFEVRHELFLTKHKIDRLKNNEEDDEYI